MIHVGDCLEVMRTLEANSVDAIVTDPPYGLRFMGKKWDYDVPSVEVWAECLRVLKPGGYLLAFAGTRTQHRMAVRIEDAGFEIRDMIAWVYGSGFPKSLDVSKAIDKAAGVEREVIGENPNHRAVSGVGYEGVYQGGNTGGATITAPATDAAKQWAGWGTALKPALEPITVARKPLAGTVAENVLAHGTGGLNIDGCRIEGAPPSVPQPSFNSPTGRTYGMKTGVGRNGEMSQASGRWPANLIHDGSDGVVALFPREAGASAPVRGTEPSNSTRSAYGDYARAGGAFHGDTGNAARFFYCAKASAADRNDGCEEMPTVVTDVLAGHRSRRMEEVRRPDGAPPATGQNHHPTVKPTDLMRYLCRLVTPRGGLVLDPFCGSGSTGRGAIAEGFRFVGIELDPEYARIAEARIRAIQPGLGL